MEKRDFHIAVFLKESLELLDIKKDGKYMDCTFGRGGHSRAILEKIGSKGFLYAIDCDLNAVDFFNKNFKKKNTMIFHDYFDNIEKIAIDNSIELLDGILYDLGVSSPQLDNHERGFSYHGDDELDMRMNQKQNFSAKELIATYTKDQLNEIFLKYGEIKKPNYVTSEIIKQRTIKPISSTKQLVDIIKQQVHPKLLHGNKHPARQYFQAIRIAVNDEFNRIERSLNFASKLLRKNGRLVIITFHSLEEKIVKKIFFNLTKTEIPKEIPVFENSRKFKIIKYKNLENESKESENVRARSAKIWCLEKL